MGNPGISGMHARALLAHSDRSNEMQDPTGIVKGSMSKGCFETFNSLAKGVPIALEDCTVLRLHASACYLCIVPANIAAVYQPTASTPALPAPATIQSRGGGLQHRQHLLQHQAPAVARSGNVHGDIPVHPRSFSCVDRPSSHAPSALATEETDLDVELGDLDAVPVTRQRSPAQRTPSLQPSPMADMQGRVFADMATPSLDGGDMPTSLGGALASTLRNESLACIDSAAAGQSCSSSGARCFASDAARPHDSESRPQDAAASACGIITRAAKNSSHPKAPSLAAVLQHHGARGGGSLRTGEAAGRHLQGGGTSCHTSSATGLPQPQSKQGSRPLRPDHGVHTSRSL